MMVKIHGDEYHGRIESGPKKLSEKETNPRTLFSIQTYLGSNLLRGLLVSSHSIVDGFTKLPSIRSFFVGKKFFQHFLLPTFPFDVGEKHALKKDANIMHSWQENESQN